MDALEKLLIVREFEELVVDFCHEVDPDWGADAHNYFTEDCSYTTSTNTRHGRAALPSKPAIMIADLRGEIVRGDDRRWHYRSRVVTPLFGDDTPTKG